MMKFSKSWNRSTKPRKQRAFRKAAPLHVKQKLMSSHLSKELRKKHGTRSLGIRKGDKVVIQRGQFKGKTGTVDTVDLIRERVLISGVDLQKKDGSKTPYPVHPSNLLITEISLGDKERQKIVNR